MFYAQKKRLVEAGKRGSRRLDGYVYTGSC